MKCLYFLLLLAVAQGFVVESRVKRETKLPAPTLKSLTAVDPPGFEVEWFPVKSDDDKDPVIGYKVKIWELPGKMTYKYETINGVKTLVEEEVRKEPMLNMEKIPDGTPEEIITDKTKLTVKKVKMNVMYETRVQAYTKTAESPMSRPMRIKLHSDEHSKDIYKTV